MAMREELRAAGLAFEQEDVDEQESEDQRMFREGGKSGSTGRSEGEPCRPRISPKEDHESGTD
jgi:hypothetical protein